MNKIKYLVLILALFLTTSCISYTELNDIGIIDTIGISKENNMYILDINMLTPKENNNNSIHYRVKSLTLENAFDKLYTLTTKEVNLSHIELLILDKILEKDDYENIINFYTNRPDSRNTFNVILLNNYNDASIKNINALEINNLLETNHRADGLIKPKTIDQIITDISTLNISYIPIINIKDTFEIIGYHSIYLENKLLTKEESIAYNFLTNKIDKCNLITDKINIKIDNSITTYKINKNIIQINIFSRIDNIEDINIKDEYKKILNTYINDFLRNNNTNYFYELIKKYNYNYYKNNSNIKIEYKINIQVSDSNER